MRNHVIAASLAFACLGGPAMATEYDDADVQACSEDAARVCPDAMPDPDKVEVCMKKNLAALSPECRARFRK